MNDLVQPGLINNRWPLMMTPDRVEFHAARPGWEAERLDACFPLMKPGDVVVDGGSESGDFTCLYKTWIGPEGAVIPVEPSPPYWAQLRAHWEGNDLGPPPPWFAGFISDVTDLNPRRDNTLGERTVGADGWPVCSHGPIIPDFGFRHLAQQADSTPQITLDDLVTRVGFVPNHIVLDIEGSEYRALKGAERTLREHRPVMWVSIHPVTIFEWYGVTTIEIHRYMEWLNYRAVYLGVGTEEYWVFHGKEQKLGL